MQKNRLNRLMAMAAVASATAVVTMPVKAAPPPPQPVAAQSNSVIDALVELFVKKERR